MFSFKAPFGVANVILVALFCQHESDLGALIASCVVKDAKSEQHP